MYGTAAPKGNNASLKTNGWELSVGWRDSFRLAGKEFRYGVKAMVWDSRTWVTKYINPTGNLDDYYEGMELGEIWGYRVEGLFRDQDDIDSHATQSFLQSSDKVTRPGQVKFADLNEDGKIDQGAKTLSDHGDLTVIGNTSGPLPLRHQRQSELERHRHFDLLAGRRQEELVSTLRFGLLLGAVQPSVRLHAQGPYGQQRLQ